MVSRLVFGSFGLRRTFPCPDTADVSVDTALVSVDTSLVSENTVLVLESRALVSEDTALVSLFPCPWSFHRCGYCTSLLGPCGGACTGALLVLSGCVCCRRRGCSIHYIWSCCKCSSSSRTLTSPSWRRGFSHGPDFSAFPYSSSSCRTRSGCPGCAVASSATGALLSMYVAVLTQRQIPAALCAGWAPGPFIDLSVGSVSGVFCCGLVVVTPPPVMKVVMSWAIQTFLCGGSRLPFGSGEISFRVCKLAKRRSKRFCAEVRGFLSEAVQFPFGFASWRKGDPNVSVRRIEASFRKRCNSLSGLQVGEKAIQTFLCGGSRLPFGSGAIPFRVCKLAKRRSKRFCAEDRGFLSEAVQFPFGFVS